MSITGREILDSVKRSGLYDSLSAASRTMASAAASVQLGDTSRMPPELSRAIANYREDARTAAAVIKLGTDTLKNVVYR